MRQSGEREYSIMTASIPGAPVVLSILVVSYNTRELTLACLRSVLEHTVRTQFELIVVENASTDGSQEAIEAEFPQVRLLKLTKNLGFGVANNLGARAAAGKFLLLLNPDTVILKNSIDRLVEEAANYPEAGIWGGRTVFPDGALNPKSCWRFISVWSVAAHAIGLSAVFSRSDILNPEAYGGWLRETRREVDFVTGCFLLIERNLWEYLGGFDENFFMYAEEADLCYRAREIGARPLFTPEATIIHYGGASEPARASKIEKLLRGRVTFVRKHWSGLRGSFAVHLMKLHVAVRVVGYFVLFRLGGADKHRERAREWHSVWQSRSEWTLGYGSGGKKQVEEVPS